jgi:hypothetical protein
VPTATLAEIMDALADQIWEAINNVLDVDVQVEPRMVLSPTPPTIDMYPADPSTDPDLRAFTDMLGGELIVVRARVQTADHEAGQDLLLALMDDEDDLSIVQAIQADPTLGGIASTLDCRERSGYITFIDSASDAALLGATWQVVVVKAKS